MPKLSLKAQNVAPLSALTLFMFGVAIAVTRGAFGAEGLSSLIPAAEALAITGVVVVWITYLVPADIKHVLVFGRLKHSLPGHRFISLSEKDSRVSNSALERVVPPLTQVRSDPAWQNQFWYSEIYRPRKDLPEVASAQKSFLLYRDAATVATISLITVAVGQQFLESFFIILDARGFGVIGIFTCLFLLAANSAGKRFVTTAVAVHLSDLEQEIGN